MCTELDGLIEKEENSRSEIKRTVKIKKFDNLIIKDTKEISYEQRILLLQEYGEAYRDFLELKELYTEIRKMQDRTERGDTYLFLENIYLIVNEQIDELNKYINKIQNSLVITDEQ